MGHEKRKCHSFVSRYIRRPKKSSHISYLSFKRADGIDRYDESSGIVLDVLELNTHAAAEVTGSLNTQPYEHTENKSIRSKVPGIKIVVRWIEEEQGGE